MKKPKISFPNLKYVDPDSSSELQGLRVQDTAGIVLGEVTAVIDGLEIACCYLHVGGQPQLTAPSPFWVPMSSVLKISDDYIEIEVPSNKGNMGGLL